MLTKWINDHYGSRRGMFNTYKHRALNYLRKYEKYRTAEWDQIRRLVFVCKGNICRSAFAEAVGRSLNIEAISCGLDTQNGKPANSMAVHAAKKRGVDLSQHQTQKITSIEIKKGDLFVVMEPSQVDHLNEILMGRYPCTLLGLWGGAVSPYIHDPYGSDEVYFDACFAYIHESVRRLVINLTHLQHTS